MNDMTDESFSTTAVAAGQLKAVIERIERLEEERKAVAEQVKEVYAEAKANGFDTKTLRKVVQLRKRSTEERQEEEALLDLYLAALGDAAGASGASDRPPRPTPVRSVIARPDRAISFRFEGCAGRAGA